MLLNIPIIVRGVGTFNVCFSEYVELAKRIIHKLNHHVA